MGKVMTVLGEVDAGDLGVTLPHGPVFHNGTLERQVLSLDYVTMLDEVGHFKASGGGTLVDLTTRDPSSGAVQDPSGSVRAVSGKSWGAARGVAGAGAA